MLEAFRPAVISQNFQTLLSAGWEKSPSHVQMYRARFNEFSSEQFSFMDLLNQNFGYQITNGNSRIGFAVMVDAKPQDRSIIGPYDEPANAAFTMALDQINYGKHSTHSTEDAAAGLTNLAILTDLNREAGAPDSWTWQLGCNAHSFNTYMFLENDPGKATQARFLQASKIIIGQELETKGLQHFNAERKVYFDDRQQVSQLKLRSSPEMAEILTDKRPQLLDALKICLAAPANQPPSLEKILKPKKSLFDRVLGFKLGQ